MPKLRPAFVDAADPIHRIVEPVAYFLSHIREIVTGTTCDAVQGGVGLRVGPRRHNVIDGCRDRSGVAARHRPRMRRHRWWRRWLSRSGTGVPVLRMSIRAPANC